MLQADVQRAALLEVVIRKYQAPVRTLGFRRVFGQVCLGRRMLGFDEIAIANPEAVGLCRVLRCIVDFELKQEIFLFTIESQAHDFQFGVFFRPDEIRGREGVRLLGSKIVDADDFRPVDELADVRTNF